MAARRSQPDPASRPSKAQRQNQQHARRRSRQTLWCLLALVGLTCVVFGPTLGNAFTTWDDTIHLTANPAFNPPTLSGILQFWTRPHEQLYIPLSYSVWGLVSFVAHSSTPDSAGIFLRPGPFHLLNLLLHAAGGCLIFQLIRQLTQARKEPFHIAVAMTCAAIYLVHPLQVESVAWLSAMRDLLSVMLCLASLVIYVRYLQSNRTGDFALSTLLFLLAMLAKPSAVILPVPAAIIHLSVRKPMRWDMVRLAVWAIAAGTCLLVTRRAQPTADLPPIPLPGRLLVALDATGFYIRQLFFPAWLGIDYGRTPQRLLDGHLGWSMAVLGGLSVVGAGLLAMRNARQRLPLAMWLLAPLPVLGLVPFAFQKISTVADRYVLLSLAGLTVGINLLVPYRHQRRFVTAGVVVVALLGIWSIIQGTHWKNSQTLFEHALRVNPQSWLAHQSLAAAALDAGDLQSARQLASQAIKLNEHYAAAMITLGNVALHRGDLSAAEIRFTSALEQEPENGAAMTNLAAVLAQTQRLDAARPLAAKAVELNPADPIARLNYATILAQHGQNTTAIEHLRHAASLAPASIQIHCNLAILLAAEGQSDEARRQLELALRIHPGNPQVLQLLKQLR